MEFPAEKRGFSILSVEFCWVDREKFDTGAKYPVWGIAPFRTAGEYGGSFTLVSTSYNSVSPDSGAKNFNPLFYVAGRPNPQY